MKSAFEILNIAAYTPKDELSLLFTSYSNKLSEYATLKGFTGNSSSGITETIVIQDDIAIRNFLHDNVYKDLYGPIIEDLIKGLINLDINGYLDTYGDKTLPLIVIADLSDSYSDDFGKIKYALIEITPQYKKGGFFISPKKCFKIILHEARGIYMTKEMKETLLKT